MIIEKARPDHAPLIAKAVMMAVGEEICEDFASPDHTLADVEKLFTTLAAMPDSQYSYNNTLVAIDPATGDVMGLCVAYDGGKLHALRRRFFEQVREQLGRDMEGMADETDPDEFYLDTVATFPAHRGKGVATALINATIARADEAHLPAALLVEKNNTRAASLYHTLGFRYRDDRPFAGVVMSHLVHTRP